MTPPPSLPRQARHEAAQHLVGVGLYAQAQSLLSIQEPDDAELGIRAALPAGDPSSAAKFLGRLIVASRAREGEVDLARGCIALVSGHAEALPATQEALDRMQPTTDDWAVFAAAAAPHDLRAAARAAHQVTGRPDPAVLAVQAAGRAANGDPAEAHWLLHDAGWTGVGVEPTARAIELLERHGLAEAARGLELARGQRRSLGHRVRSWQRRRTERDLRCRCAQTPVHAGPGSRYYVSWHLELQERADDWRILSCSRTGTRYLDYPSVPVSVRITP